MTQPKLAVQKPDGTRVYRHPVTGEEFPAVSTVIGAGVAKPFLVPWAAKMAAQYAIDNWNDLNNLDDTEKLIKIRTAHQVYADGRASVGDIVHEIIECAQTGQPYPQWGKEVNGYINQFINFMLDVQPRFIESEVTLCSRKHNYAGTADWIAEIDGKIVYGDNKTGKRVYPEVGLQLGALANCDFILREDGTEDPMPEPDYCAALHIRPRSWKLTPIHHPVDCFNAFLAARQILFWSQKVAPDVL